MDLINIVLAILGTTVSILLFLIAHRKTIGARQERVRSANDELEKLLVRRVVLEDFNPAQDEIIRLIDTKARDFRVRPTDLLSDIQIMNNIYTRIVESDFLLHEQRQNVLDRITNAIQEVGEQPLPEQAVEQVDSQKRYRSSMSNMLAFAAVGASVMGATLSILPDINEIVKNTEKLFSILPMAIATVFMSLVMISFISLIYRIRERQQDEPNRATTIEKYVAFENEVFRTLKDSGVSIIRSNMGLGKNRGYDFSIERGDTMFFVEVKNWTRQVPPSLVSRTYQKLQNALAQEDASYAIIVVPRTIEVASHLPDDDRVKMMTLSELRKHLARKK